MKRLTETMVLRASATAGLRLVTDLDPPALP